MSKGCCKVGLPCTAASSRAATCMVSVGTSAGTVIMAAARVAGRAVPRTEATARAACRTVPWTAATAMGAGGAVPRTAAIAVGAGRAAPRTAATAVGVGRAVHRTEATAGAMCGAVPRSEITAGAAEIISQPAGRSACVTVHARPGAAAAAAARDVARATARAAADAMVGAGAAAGAGPGAAAGPSSRAASRAAAWAAARACTLTTIWAAATPHRAPTHADISTVTLAIAGADADRAATCIGAWVVGKAAGRGAAKTVSVERAAAEIVPTVRAVVLANTGVVMCLM